MINWNNWFRGSMVTLTTLHGSEKASVPKHLVDAYLKELHNNGGPISDFQKAQDDLSDAVMDNNPGLTCFGFSTRDNNLPQIQGGLL